MNTENIELTEEERKEAMKYVAYEDFNKNDEIDYLYFINSLLNDRYKKWKEEERERITEEVKKLEDCYVSKEKTCQYWSMARWRINAERRMLTKIIKELKTNTNEE